MTTLPPISTDQLTKQTHTLCYLPPYAWSPLRDFYVAHPVPAQEWLEDNAIGRTFALNDTLGYFTAYHLPKQAAFTVELWLNRPEHSAAVLRQIRHMLDLDLNPQQVEGHLHACFPHLPLVNGLRIPRVWSIFEAGIRAILGQQISVGAASKLVSTLVATLGHPIATSDGTRYLFPTPASLRDADLGFLSMVSARRDTLKRFAAWYCTAGIDADCPERWLPLKGIGPWTVNNAALRGRGDVDMWVGGDLGIRKAMKVFDPEDRLDINRATPWRSYLTQQLWCLPAAWMPAR